MSLRFVRKGFPTLDVRVPLTVTVVGVCMVDPRTSTRTGRVTIAMIMDVYGVFRTLGRVRLGVRGHFGVVSEVFIGVGLGDFLSVR